MFVKSDVIHVHLNIIQYFTTEVYETENTYAVMHLINRNVELMTAAWLVRKIKNIRHR